MVVRQCRVFSTLIRTAIMLLVASAAVEPARAAVTPLREEPAVNGSSARSLPVSQPQGSEANGRAVEAAQLPVIHRFVASRNELTAGEPVTLSWSVTGSTSIRLSGITNTPSSPVTVFPDASTIYTLTATNASGSVHAPASVTVHPGEAIVPTASVDVNSPGLEVPSTFMGLGIGGTSYAGVMGAPATGTNPIYRKLLKNLTAYGSGPILIKITGDTDTVPSAYDVSALAQLNKDIGAQFYVGLNLKSDSTDLAVQQADAFTSGMPLGSIIAAEIGNEPDLYVEQGYRSSYTAAEFLANYAEFRSAVLPTLESSHARLAGPAWSDSSSLANLPAFLAQEHANLAVVKAAREVLCTIFPSPAHRSRTRANRTRCFRRILWDG